MQPAPGLSERSELKGFTLIELLVVISIIAILSIIGLTIFTGVQKGARDSRRKADIDAIVKVMEVNYGKFTPGVYPALCQVNPPPTTITDDDCNKWFTNGLPKDPINTVPYKYCFSYSRTVVCGVTDTDQSRVLGPGNPPEDFIFNFCAKLEGGGSYCLSTSQ